MWWSWWSGFNNDFDAEVWGESKEWWALAGIQNLLNPIVTCFSKGPSAPPAAFWISFFLDGFCQLWIIRQRPHLRQFLQSVAHESCRDPHLLCTTNIFPVSTVSWVNQSCGNLNERFTGYSLKCSGEAREYPSHLRSHFVSTTNKWVKCHYISGQIDFWSSWQPGQVFTEGKQCKRRSKWQYRFDAWISIIYIQLGYWQ